MNYANYPTPIWISECNWKITARETPWKIDAIIRDGYKCVDCGNGNSRLIIHHIDESRKIGKLNNELSNLVTLCKKCHAKRHGLISKLNPILLKLKEYVPDMKIRNGTLTYVANEMGCSRERVRQIAKMAGYQPAFETARYEKIESCWVCGKKFSKSNLSQTNLFCSPKCSIIHNEQKYWDIYQCEWCKLYFKNRRKLQKLRGQRFCSMSCKGKWLASKYGLGTPNNSGLCKKYPSNEVIRIDFKEPFTTKEFAKKYGYVSSIGARNAITTLLFNDVIETYKVKGLYRIKN